MGWYTWFVQIGKYPPQTKLQNNLLIKVDQ